ncbi:hypothetical protein WR25_17036 [Diploscapter pachys]|uniref:Uncharacterized protein n=1 Tax=Diploscapter pachys TaxID=2018661 RepID=A0A2A2KJU0_9BILA|nr:hypothetical protein WR25_17036 [Diploscapter pachys]
MPVYERQIWTCLLWKPLLTQLNNNKYRYDGIHINTYSHVHVHIDIDTYSHVHVHIDVHNNYYYNRSLFRKFSCIS